MGKEFVDVTVPLVKSLTKRERARARWVTVEPVIALAMIGFTVTSLLRPLYLKQRIRGLYNITDLNNMTECGTSNNTVDLMDAHIQSEVSIWQLYLSAASGIPAIITAVIFGTISDNFGRKLCMALPIVGFILQEIVYWATIYFNLPLPVLFVGELLQGFSGGFALMFSGCMSYLSDSTSVEQRTFRIVFTEMLTYSLGGLSQIGEGYLIKYYGYLPPLYIAIGINILVVMYITIPPFLIETVQRDAQVVNKGKFREAGRSMVRLLAFNENGRRWQMLLLDFLIFSVLLAAMGNAAILVLYGTAQPFCWSSDTAGLASATSLLSMSLGMLIGTKLFSVCLNDYWLMQIGCLSMCIMLIGLALAKSTLVIFIALCLGTFRGISIPVARSVLSKITNQDETGAMFAIVACLESISMLISVEIASGLYAATVAFLPPLTFFAYAGFCIIPAGIILALQIFWPRKNEYKPLGLSINTE